MTIIICPLQINFGALGIRYQDSLVYNYFPTVRLPFSKKEGNLSGSFVLGQSLPKLWLMYGGMEALRCLICFCFCFVFFLFLCE